MKHAFEILGLTALAAASALAGVADYSIDNLTLTARQPWDDVVEISFAVVPPAGGTTAKAVELDIVASNGVDEVFISDAAISTRMAAPGGAQKIYWRPDVDHPGRSYGNVRVYVSVKSEVESQPPYLLVNLNDGVIGYAGLSVTNAIKKMFFFQDVMAFRYIPPTTSDEWKAISGGDDFFWYGTDEHDAGYNYKLDSDIAREDRRHRVKLTKGFYLGVYPVMRGQMGMLNVVGFQRQDEPGAVATAVTYEQARGADTVGGYNAPTSTEVDPNSIVGKMRKLTGRAFDLPTSFQWEYACRAGSTNVYLFTASVPPSPGYFWETFQDLCPQTKPANRWGLYGLVGCCHQWTTTLGRTSNSASVNDNFYTLTEDATDPTGPAATYDHPYRVCRGSHRHAAGETDTRDGKRADIRYRVYRMAYKLTMRTNDTVSGDAEMTGLRLCLPVDE